MDVHFHNHNLDIIHEMINNGNHASDFLAKEDFQVKNKKGSMGNFGISKSIVKEILDGYQPDLVIIQWSGIVQEDLQKKIVIW